MGPAIFWGLFMIVIGFALIIKYVFNLDIPVGKIVIALFFIFIGIKLLVGQTKFFHTNNKETNIIFNDTRLNGKDISASEYNVIFGKLVLDLRDIELSDLPKRLEVNTIFGATEILINDSLPIHIKTEAVFSGARLPNGNTVTFGSSEYSTFSYNPSDKFLMINNDVIFGGLEVK
ncbi:MAG: hypothetical protein J7K53_10065 [Bacteroidales bacterium]|nr:hypothetical protein [Bacteroidales bacterium]